MQSQETDLFCSVPTRRKFLVECSALIAAALAAPAATLAGPITRSLRKRSLDEISLSALARQMNTPFRILAESGTIRTTLAEVKIRPERRLEPGQRPAQDACNEKFSLVFSGAPGDVLKQDTYPIAHDTLGRFDLFLVPINTGNPAKADYLAVVNRPRKHALKET